ncbi:MAG: peptidoglycan editing factor PgeF [Clostridia bacterium]
MEYKNAAALVKHGYIYEETKGIGFFRAESLKQQQGLLHGFSARVGGISAPPYDTLNLGWSRPEPETNVTANFKLFCMAAGLQYGQMCVVNYEHGTNVLPVTNKDCGRGFAREPLPFCDGLVTNDPNVVLITSHADCGAYFLFDPIKHVIGLTHAGWKGTLGRIGARAVELMQNEYGTDPKDIIASTGPCICIDCFEVDMELAKCFEKEFDCACYRQGKPGKAQLDIEIPAVIQFMDAGLLPEHITMMQACTYEMEDKLFSYRRDHGETGSMAAYMKLI